MDKEKAQLILINNQIEYWFEDRDVQLINKNIMPLKFNSKGIENDVIIKNSFKENSDFLTVNRFPYSANNILNEAKKRLAESIVNVMFDNGIICMEDLILETEEERAKKNIETGEVKIINPQVEYIINTTEDMIKKVLQSTNEVLIVDVTSSNNVEGYIEYEGGEVIEGFLKALIESDGNDEGRGLIKSFEILAGVWDVVDILNERVDEYIRE